jgi:hypothetical protein
MRIMTWTLAAAIAVLPSVASAQLVNSFHFIPVIAKAGGLNGTFWQSDVSISNLSGYTVTVGAKYFPSDVANTFNGTFPKSVPIASGQTLLVQDVLGTWFPSAGQGKGFLILADTTPVNCNVSSPPKAWSGLLAVSSRTYNTGDPRGTFSTAADPNLTGMNITTFPSVITGIRQTGMTAPGYRTNLSIANFSTTRIRVLIRIYYPNGALAATESLQTIESLSFRQWQLSDFGVTNLGAGAGRIEVRLDPALVADPCTSVTDTFCTNPCDPTKCFTKYAMRSEPTFFAYGSTTDNGTGDGVLLSPVVDWQGYSKYTSDYRNAHCPNNTIARDSAIGDLLRAKGLIERDPPPTFQKVKK